MTMATVGDIYELLNERAPFSMQMDFDNAGFLVGRRCARVQRVLVALDITQAVVEEAAEKGCQLIVSHHPVIWGGAKSVTDETLTGRKILAMAEHGIAAICAHTNLDMARGGVNDALAAALGLGDVQLLGEESVDLNGRPCGLGRVGYVREQSLAEFAALVKAALGTGGVRACGGGKPVRKVAVGGGACGNMIMDVLDRSCDTFVTADVKHDMFLDAQGAGLNLIDAGHYATEHVVCRVLLGWLEERFPELVCVLSQAGRDPAAYY